MRFTDKGHPIRTPEKAIEHLRFCMAKGYWEDVLGFSASLFHYALKRLEVEGSPEANPAVAIGRWGPNPDDAIQEDVLTQLALCAGDDDV